MSRPAPVPDPLPEPALPPHRAADLTWDCETQARSRLIHSAFCARCSKLLLKTKANARSYIGLLVVRKLRPGGWAIHPYRCPYSRGWHVGRDPHAMGLLKERTGK